MKTIGLLGGMSWESTAVYYQLLNAAVRERKGGLHSARVLLHSFDFADIVDLQRGDDWDEASRVLSEAGQGLERAGADVLAICTNTMHKLAPEVQEAVSVPLLHIADAARKAVVREGLDCVGLLGTRYTMEQEFLRRRLMAFGGPHVLVPDSEAMDVVHDVIFSELCAGEVRDVSREALLQVIDGLAARGAQGIVLGCTELMLLLKPEHCALPLFDTAALHVAALVEFSLDGNANPPFVCSSTNRTQKAEFV